MPARPACWAVAAILVATSALSAQSTSEPWFGIPLPGGLALPQELSVVFDPSFETPPPAAPGREEGFSDLEGVRIQDDLREIVSFSHQSRQSGLRMWGRVSGFPAAEATAEWVADRYRDVGLSSVQVQRYRANAPLWWPDDWEVRVVGSPAFGAGTDDVVLRSAVPTRGSFMEASSLTAPLVYVGESDELFDVDVEGKVAVFRHVPTGGAASQRGAIRAAGQALFERGAVAVVNIFDQAGNMQVRDFSGCGPVCFTVGAADGAFLRDVLDRADAAGEEVEARMQLDAGDRTELSAQNVVGVVPGDSDEVVIVNAHLDGWYDAAGDNGDGLAVQIALARHFARPTNRPARTLVFVASGGHHSSGLNGPEHFVEMNPDLAERAVLVLNLEHIAQFLVEMDPWRVEPTEQDMGWGITNLAPFLVELTDRGVERYGFRIRSEYSNSVPGDLGRYDVLGVPRVQAIHAGPLYHTTGDVFESISVNGLERAARFYRFFIQGVAEASLEKIDP